MVQIRYGFGNKFDESAVIWLSRIRIRSNRYDPTLAKENKTGYYLIGFLEPALEHNDDDVIDE